MIEQKDRKQLGNKEGNIEKEIYRVSEFCTKFAISRTSFYREINAHRLAVFKRGRITLVSRDEAERWLYCLGYIKSLETLDKRYSSTLKSP